jgi:hypothetical protein
MKSVMLGITAALFMIVGVSLAAQKYTTYTGEVMDSACAQMGSHDAMTKNNPKMTAKDCTVACVQHGAKYVLYDAATKAVYQLDDQKKPARFAGAKVTVTGTLDAGTKTIHVISIVGPVFP